MNISGLIELLSVIQDEAGDLRVRGTMRIENSTENNGEYGLTVYKNSEGEIVADFDETGLSQWKN